MSSKTSMFTPLLYVVMYLCAKVCVCDDLTNTYLPCACSKGEALRAEETSMVVAEVHEHGCCLWKAGCC